MGTTPSHVDETKRLHISVDLFRTHTHTHLPVTLVARRHSLEQRLGLRVFDPRAVEADHLPALAGHPEDLPEQGLCRLPLLVGLRHEVVRGARRRRQQVLD